MDYHTDYTHKTMERRTFLRTAAAAGLLIPGARAAAAPRKVGLIGSGWYGKQDLFRLVQVEPIEIVALSDVDTKMLEAAATMASERQKSGKKPHTYADYRDLLKQEELDIVLVAPPDHWHALPMIDAVRAGADVYVQKPVGVDVMEGQAMLAAARKYNRVVQVGTQRRSTPHLIDAKKRIIDEGKLGKVAHAEICCYYHMRAKGNPPDGDPPAHLDYEAWTGPAPMRPYNPLVHPRSWRAFMEYGNGIVGDMCVHMLDMVRWMLDLGWPERISSDGGIFIEKGSKANITDTQTATFEFEELPIVWNHRSWGHPPDPDYPWAAFLYGEKGTLKASVHKWEFIPLDKNGKTEGGEAVYEQDKYPEEKTEEGVEKHVTSAIRGHMLDFLSAVDNRTRPVADIEQGHISSSSCVLANVAMKLGRTLEWDAKKQRVVNDNEANRMLARPYRKPWVHPDPKTV